jgi:two-component system, LuxR family, sensor kinase FixL
MARKKRTKQNTTSDGATAKSSASSPKAGKRRAASKGRQSQGRKSPPFESQTGEVADETGSGFPVVEVGALAAGLEELRQAQAELAHTRDRYADLYEFAPVGYLTLNRGGGIVEANLTAAAMLGVERQTLLQSNLSTFVDRESRDDFCRYRQAMFATGDAHESPRNELIDAESQICELQMHKADGTLLVLRLKSIPFGDANDLQCLTALIDITRRRQAELTVRRLNETLEERVTEQTQENHLLAEAVAHLGEGVVITEDELDWPGPRIVFVNEAMCRITGYTAGELIGQSPRILQGQETDRATLDRIKALLSANRPCEVELVNYRKDGTPYNAELFITPLFNADGERTNFVSIHRDVTEKERAAQALQEQEAFVRSVFASPVANIAVLDGNGRILAVNAAWQRFAQANGGSTLIQSSVGVNYLDICRAAVESGDELAGEALRGLQEVMDGTKTVFSLEYPCHSPSEERWFQMTVTPAHLEGGGVVVAHLPITERKQAEESLRREHELSEGIINTAEHIILLLDTEGRILRFNPFLERLSGWTLAEVQGRNWFDTFLPERARERVRDVFASALGGERTRANVDVMVTKDGRSLDVEWFDTPLTSADGELIGLLCTGQDVTEQRQAAEALRESEQRFRAIFDHAATGIAITDWEGRYIMSNPAYCEIVGYEDAELRRLVFPTLIHPDDVEENLDLIEQLKSEEVPAFRIENRYVRKDGNAVWVQKFVSILRDDAGQPTHLIALVTDVTDQKRIQDALRDREERMRAVLNTAADAIITIDEAGIIEGVNPATERMFGYAAAELVGRNVRVLMPPNYRDEHDNYISQFLKTGEARIIGSGREVTGRRNDGSTFPVDLSVSRIEHLGLFTGIIRDISERKALQQHLLEIAADQQRRIGQDLHDDVGQELVALGMTAGTLTQTIEELCTDEESGEVLRMSRKLADGLRECLQKVRFLSRGLVPVEVDAEGLATALQDLATQIGQLHHVNCTFDSPTAIPINDNTTATHLYRIAQEAVTNALKHGQPHEIRISLAEHNGLIVLEVADDGTGMPQPVPLQKGAGLRTMNYRAGLIGARLGFRPGERGGTLVSCVLNRY